MGDFEKEWEKKLAEVNSGKTLHSPKPTDDNQNTPEADNIKKREVDERSISELWKLHEKGLITDEEIFKAERREEEKRQRAKKEKRDTKTYQRLESRKEQAQREYVRPSISVFEEYKNAFAKYGEFKGRSTAREFWSFFFLNILLGGAIGVLVGVTIGVLVPVFSILLVIGLAIPHLSVGVRRLHDTNRSGWYFLIALIPLGNLVLLVFFCQAGTAGDNDYGPNPTIKNSVTSIPESEPIKKPYIHSETSTTEADFREPQKIKSPPSQEYEPQQKEADSRPKAAKNFCSQCGEKLTIGAKFCSACGAAV